jgi:DNA-binding XRE family transcriptional regulator
MRPEHITAWRNEIGWSKCRLAKALGVHRRTISAWERGRQSSPPFLGLALAELKRRNNLDTVPRARLIVACLSGGRIASDRGFGEFLHRRVTHRFMLGSRRQ